MLLYDSRLYWSWKITRTRTTRTLRTCQQQISNFWTGKTPQIPELLKKEWRNHFFCNSEVYLYLLYWLLYLLVFTYIYSYYFTLLILLIFTYIYLFIFTCFVFYYIYLLYLVLYIILVIWLKNILLFISIPKLFGLL